MTPTPLHVRARLSRGVHEILVQWTRLPNSEASWGPLEDFRRQFSSFQLKDKLVIEGGRNVMVGIQQESRESE